MVAFSGLEAALGALNGYDRQQPWSGHYWNGVYPTTNVGKDGLAAIGDGGTDDWFYGELFKKLGAGYTGTERPYGKAIPQIGEWVAKDRDSYQYLVESIRRFPDQQTFAGMIRKAGFSGVGFSNFTGGVAAMHTGRAL